MDFNLAESLAYLLPSMTYKMPGLGEVDFAPYLIAAIVFFGLLLIFKIVLSSIISRLKKISTKTSTDFDDVLLSALGGIRSWVYVVVALFVSLRALALPSWADATLLFITLIAVVWQFIEIAVRLISYASERLLLKDENGDGVPDPNTAMASQMVTLFARVTLWSLGLLFVLSNLGIEVTSLIAGLGIGGIAIAFALQGILSDLFSFFSIYFDKPFRIGDFIVVGQDSGTVEKIGIKTTRIRTLQGEELVVSNAELTTARVQNFKKMSERRIVFQFGITYETPHERAKEVPGVMTRIFEAIDGARLDRAHFTAFGDFALLYEVVYYVESSNYKRYLDIQQKINFELMDRFSELGIEFAYPTQTLYVKQGNN